jgi:MFS family permease
MSEASPRRWKTGFTSLRHRNYRLYWFGQAVSITGQWMQATAQGWLVLQLTNRPLEVGLVTALQFTPTLLLAIFGGTIADRFDRHKVVRITQTLAMSQAILYAILVSTGTIALPWVFALALGLGLVNAVDTPVRQSFVVQLVPREEIPNAVALNSLIVNVGRIVGPAVAGLIIAKAGMAPAFWLNAASFIAVIGALLLMDRTLMSAAPDKPSESVWAGIKEAVNYARGHATVRLVLVVMFFFGAFGYNFNTLIPLIGKFILHVDPVQFGGLTSAMGVGSLLGALTATALPGPNPIRLLKAGAAFAGLLATLALVNILPVAYVILAFLGAAAVLFSTAANTLVQTSVEDHMRGRTLSLYWMCFSGTTPIGATFVGVVSTLAGVKTTVIAAGVLCAVGVILGTLMRRQSAKP